MNKFIEYKLLSSITGGLNEVYNTFEEIKERFNYIKNHKEEFKSNSMIFAYMNVYNENGKIVDWKTLGIIDFNKEV